MELTNNEAQPAVARTRNRSLAASFSVFLALVLGPIGEVSNCAEPFQPYPFGFDLVVGRPGSDIEMVLSTVYHIGNQPPNFPYRYYLQLKSHRLVKDAVPIALGDTTAEGGFPIVATTRGYFDAEYAPGKKLLIKGRGFEENFTAIIGADVAKENNWSIDDPDTMEDEASRFRVVHGRSDTGGHVHAEEFRVVGILKKTGTQNDWAVFVNLNGFYEITGHAMSLEKAIEREREFFVRAVPDISDPDRNNTLQLAQKEVTAVFVKTEHAIGTPMLAAEINHSHRMNAVRPAHVIQEFQDITRMIAVKNPEERPSQDQGVVMALLRGNFVIYAAFLALTLLCAAPLWLISKKAGFPGWSRIAAWFPVLNVVLLGFLAFCDWPSLSQNELAFRNFDEAHDGDH